jgi:ketosteroid isomerase-like protein
MAGTAMTDAAAPLLGLLRDALNAHDVDALVALFHPDYRSEQPFHPERDFTGTGQVRRNWTTIFAMMPDFRAEILRSGAGAQLWAEWRWSGTERGGSPVVLGGVTIIGVDDSRIRWARLYIEPVDTVASD